MKTNKEMTNHEIIVAEVKTMFEGFVPDCWKDGSSWSIFATFLLSKLQTLDRDRVEKIILEIGEGAESVYVAIDQICQLIPQEGVVIAEGKINVYGDFIEIKSVQNKVICIEDIATKNIKKLDGEKVQLIIKVVK